MNVLYEHTIKREFDRMKFEASIHGIDLEKELKEQGVEMPKEDGSKAVEAAPFLFGDPEDYKDMPMDEREALTQKMKGQHKTWAKHAVGLEAVEKRG